MNELKITASLARMLNPAVTFPSVMAETQILRVRMFSTLEENIYNKDPLVLTFMIWN